MTLLGRAVECAVFDHLIDDLRGGESRSLVLRGEAGIGKSALLEHLVASASDLTVERAMGVESEMELAFAGLHQLCGPMLDRLERLPVPQREALEIVFGLTAGAAPDRFLVALATLSLFSEVAEERPLLCVVDDAQWLDHASALTLAFVARRLFAEPVGIVFAARETGEELRSLSELEVHGLRAVDARALLSAGATLQLDAQVRDRIIAETRGNPLALLELPQGFTAAELAGGFGPLGPQALTGRIEESFLRRLEALPGEVRRFMLAAAADPVGDPALLLRAAKRLAVGPEAAEEAKRQGLVAIGERVTLRHPLARSAVYRSASPQERRAVHQALAEATDRAADPDRRAWHLAAAAAGPDEEVAMELQRSAGRAQARGGLAAAAAFLQRAVALTGDAGRRAERALAAAEACVQAGTFDEARSLLATAEAASLDELEQARVELLRGQLALLSSFGSDAVPLLLNAARRLQRLDADLARDTYLDAWGAALLAGRLSTGCGLLDVSRAARSMPRSDGAHGPPDVLLESLATLVSEGRGAAADALEQAIGTFADEQLPSEAMLRWGWLSVVPTYALWDEAGTYVICSRQLQAAREAGGLARLPLHLATLTLLAVRCGDFVGAEGAIAEADALAAATGSALTSRGVMTLAAFRGREAEARSSIEAVREEASSLGQGVALELTEWLFGVMCNGLGRYEEAASALAAIEADPVELFVSTWTAVELVEAATRSHDSELAVIALDRVVTATAFAGTESAQGILARCRALVSEGEIAERLFQEAIERLGRTRLRPELARAHLLYGEWLRRRNRRVDARARLRAAHQQFASIGMEAFAGRARTELVATGGTARKRAPETRDELTAQELQIARFARDGLSNPEIGARLFLSPRTVEWHLRKVFSKLEIRSRHDLPSALPSSEPELAPA